MISEDMVVCIIFLSCPKNGDYKLISSRLYCLSMFVGGSFEVSASSFIRLPCHINT